MKTITMLDLRQRAEEIIAQVQKGQRLILTRRGKPVARLEPFVPPSVTGDDPFYAIDELAVEGGEPLSNRQIDEIVYGQ
jgi:prevent-host-death family protein